MIDVWIWVLSALVGAVFQGRNVWRTKLEIDAVRGSRIALPLGERGKLVKIGVNKIVLQGAKTLISLCMLAAGLLVLIADPSPMRGLSVIVLLIATNVILTALAILESFHNE